MTSIVFPGQGSQFLGMAKDFHDNFDLAKKIFEEIEDYSKIDLRKIIFEDKEKKLNITRFTPLNGHLVILGKLMYGLKLLIWTET